MCGALLGGPKDSGFELGMFYDEYASAAINTCIAASDKSLPDDRTTTYRGGETREVRPAGLADHLNRTTPQQHGLGNF